MSRYDGLIIPRSYSEYINKTDAATLSQALQLPGVMDSAPTACSVHPVKSGGIYAAIEAKNPVDMVALNNMNSVTSNAVYAKLLERDTQQFTTSYKVGVFVFTRIGDMVTVQTGGGDWNDLPIAQYTNLFELPAKFRPLIDVSLLEQTGVKISINILTSGVVRVYNYENRLGAFNGNYIRSWLAAS